MRETRLRDSEKPTGAAPSEELGIRFVNTVAWRNGDVPGDRLTDAGALLDWLESAAVADAGAIARLTVRWGRRKLEANAAYRQALELREAIYGLFLARMRASLPPPGDLRALNRILAASTPRIAAVEIRSSLGMKTSWRLAPVRATPIEMLATIAWSAAELMTGERAGRVRQCADDRGCGWLFLDQSRLNNRRWCSMGDCGNRAKARRHYLRRKKTT
jgi:predicted RNA-binding Zn ribbon-like protein